MLKIRIEATGVKETQKAIKAVKEVITDLTPEMKIVGSWLKGLVTEDVFATQGSIIESPWAPLSKDYYKQKHSGSSPFAGRGTLIRSGDLQAGWHLYSSSTYALLNNPVPYGVYHQQPDGPGKGIIPRRPLFKLTSQIESEIMKRFKKSLEGRIKNAVGK
jgi:phage gpG-like protein